MKGTELAFRTPLGGQSIPSGTTISLTNNLPKGIPVKSYPTIRVACDNRNGSDSDVTLLFTINQAGELVVHLDKVTLAPGSSFTKTYDVPGIGLTIDAITEAGTGSSTVDVLVYGYSPYTRIKS